MRHRRIQEPDIDGLERLSRTALRALWAQEFGEKPPLSIGRDILALGIAYVRQERRHGGLAKPVARELDRLFHHALDNDLTGAAPALISPVTRSGTVLVREWRGTQHHVTIVADGFSWNGITHRSLSSIARAITGTRWNGPRFFGMRETNPKTEVIRHGG